MKNTCNISLWSMEYDYLLHVYILSAVNELPKQTCVCSK